MLYLHDVWVNWFEGEENGYNVSYFHEWRRDDTIELIESIPIIYIEEDLFDHIENSLEDLPEQLLEDIYKQTYIRKGHKKQTIDYACIITDGIRTLVFDTINYSIPMRKSRLIPRQDQMVLQRVRNRKPTTYKYQKRSIDKQYHLLSLKPELVIGLTRKEKQLKQLLMMALDHLRVMRHLKALRYWLIEWRPELSSKVEHYDEDEAWQALYHDIKIGWSKDHERFTKKLIKGNSFLEKLWDQEQADSINESKLS